MKRVVFLMAVLFCLVLSGIAQEARPLADDPEVERRLANLSQELRCLVCQNETLADSRADLAVDLRNQIREQIKAGKTDKEIIAYLTARYGDFVLYRPPVKPATYLLWFGPFLLLAGGLIFLFQYVRHRKELIVETPLSDEERTRAKAMLDSSAGKEPA